MKEHGAVKWFNDKKGYGFISRDSNGKDIFVHFTAIVGNGHKTLREGQRVEFEIEREKRGERAVNVTVI